MKRTILRLGLLISGLATASLLTTSARAETAAPLRLQLTLEEGRPQLPHLSLLDPDDGIPRTVHQTMLGEIASAMDAELESFRASLADGSEEPTLEGGGDGGDALLVVLAAILGFFPGFGLGHLVAGHIGGFILFLVVDLLLSGVFFVVFPILGFSFWYVPSAIVVFVERIVEAVLAGEAATRPGWVELTPVPSDERRAAVQATLPILTF